MKILDFEKKKQQGQKITMVTCYDHWSAQIIERSKVDCVLVGDSVAMVVHGYPSTIHATVEMMKLHTEAVAKGLKTKFLVGDMPFLSFRKGVNFALDAAASLMQAGAHAVKIEGVWGHEEVISQLVQSGIPVMGHIGLTPQSVHQIGGFKVQGQSSDAAEDLIRQAEVLQELGCFALVAECVPSGLGEQIASSIRVPLIGIGAGNGVDGQVLVLQDLLGMNGGFKPKFLRKFLDGHEMLLQALNDYSREVQTGSYPLEQESYL